MAGYVFVTRWSNVGGWLHRHVAPSLGIKTPWGNLIVKPWADRLFTERYGYTPVWKVFGLCVSWVRLRKFVDG